jgi:3-hydroxyisobutyrate dehydrogenase-like beta-hydroxyacid dehydrogenase
MGANVVVVPSMRVGFIGLGRVGLPMCQELARAAHAMLVYDVRPEAINKATALCGAKSAKTGADVAARSDAVLISVAGPSESALVMLGADGVLAGGSRGLLVIDTTTSAVAQSQDLSRRAAEVGIDYLDAPVSLTEHNYGRGNRTVMVGGDRGAFVRALPLLESIATHVHYVGASGLGTAAKLLNQSIYVTYLAAFAEGLALGERSGLDRDILLDVLSTSAAGSPRIASKFDEIRGLSGDRFAIDSALRYLALGQEAFPHVALVAPVINAATASLRDAAARGAGGEDIIVARHRYLGEKIEK